MSYGDWIGVVRKSVVGLGVTLGSGVFEGVLVEGIDVALGSLVNEGVLVDGIGVALG